jgi:hypothetical protein
MEIYQEIRVYINEGHEKKIAIQYNCSYKGSATTNNDA